MQLYRPTAILVEKGEEDSPIVQRVRERLPDVPFRMVERGWGRENFSPNGTDAFGEGKRRLFLTRFRGSFLQHCPAGTPGLMCCNYLVVNLISNCPMECSYCFLQEYLANNPTIKVFTNISEALNEVAAVVDRHPLRPFRVGTGELSDSLVLDPLLDVTSEIVPFFAARSNVLLELKTKSNCIENLLGLDSQGRTVVSWSITPPEIIDAEEHGTASFAERVEAARRCQVAGYKVGFHFDPLVEYPGWEEGYQATVARIFTTVDPRRVAWVSLGSLRFSPRLKSIIRSRFPGTRALCGEQVPCPDGKWRSFQALRVAMYRLMVQWLRGVSPDLPVYLCMETREVWEKVFGSAPVCDKGLGQILAMR